MSPKNSGSSRQGNSGTQSIDESGALPAPGAMSDLLGSAGRRVAQILHEADATSKSIIEQAQTDAQQHNENAMREAERLSRQRIERLDEITAQVSAQAGALQRHAQELTHVMRRSHDSLSEELGAALSVETGGSGVEAKRTLEPTRPPSDEQAEPATEDAEDEEPVTKPPVALRELFGFKRKRFTDDPPPNEVARVRAEMLVASSGDEADR
jgi:hypothetical protein